MSNVRPLITGVPYGPDVRRLEQAYPVSSLEKGMKIPKDEFAAVFQESWGTNRCQGVWGVFKKMLRRDHGIVAKPEGDHISILDDDACVDEVTSGLKGVGRRLKVVNEIGSVVDRKNLSAEKTKSFDHAEMVTASMTAAGRLKPISNGPSAQDLIGDQR